MLAIWEFVQTILLIVGVPETNSGVLVRRKAQRYVYSSASQEEPLKVFTARIRLRRTSGDSNYYAAVEREDNGSILHEIGQRALKIVRKCHMRRPSLHAFADTMYQNWLSTTA